MSATGATFNVMSGYQESNGNERQSATANTSGVRLGGSPMAIRKRNHMLTRSLFVDQTSPKDNSGKKRTAGGQSHHNYLSYATTGSAEPSLMSQPVIG